MHAIEIAAPRFIPVLREHFARLDLGGFAPLTMIPRHVNAVRANTQQMIKHLKSNTRTLHGERGSMGDADRTV